MKFLKGVALYILCFIGCMIVVTTALKHWSDGAQMLFAFGMPAFLLWWFGRGRRKVSQAKGQKVTPESVGIKRNARMVDQGSAQRRSTAAEPVRANQPAMSASPASRSKPSRFTGRRGWIPKGETVTIAGRDINGMIYVGSGPNQTGRDADRSRPYIDPTLPVAPIGSDRSGDGMSYWPGYWNILPVCRATYLDWLVGGRSDGSVSPGYMFLYFYGLERRFLVDKPNNAEKGEILAEVQRLRNLFKDNHSVQRYLGDFIDLASIMVDDADFKKPIFKNWGWDVPLALKVSLGGAIANDMSLSADWLLSWFLCHSEKRLRKPAHQCEDEFMALFRLKFAQRYPNDLKVRKPTKHLQYSYRAASSEFSGDIPISANGQPVLDISGLRKPIEIAQEIADQAMDELDKFSRYLSRNPEGRGSLEAQALLPADLWSLFPSEELQKLKTWAEECVNGGGLVGVEKIVAKFEGQMPAKIVKRQLIDVADALGRVGFGLAPDPRYALRSPREGEPVVIFALGGAPQRLEEVSPAYRDALIEQALGSFIAHADGVITESEKEALSSRIDQTDGLSEVERCRLRANLEWLLVVPPDMALLRSRLKDADVTQQAVLRAAMVSIAYADGTIQKEEVTSLEKIYKILGLDPSTVYSDLHAGEIADAPVSMKAAEPAAPGEAIPAEAPAAAGPRLDLSRIAAIRSDTERVSAVLGQIFAGDQNAPPEIAEAASPIPGLDGRHAALVREIIERERWTEQAFVALAAKHGLMAAGAMEAINEWSFSIYDEALLDEYDGYDVAGEIAKNLKMQLKKEAA